MTPDPLLDYASKRAYDLNLASAWGTDPDGALINLLLERIEKLSALLTAPNHEAQEHNP